MKKEIVEIVPILPLGYKPESDKEKVEQKLKEQAIMEEVNKVWRPM